MNSLFGRTTGNNDAGRSAVDAAIADSSAAAAAGSATGATISPSTSLSEALQLDEDTSLTFHNPSDASLKPDGQVARSNSEGNLQNKSSPASVRPAGVDVSVVETAVASDGKGTGVAAVSASAGGGEAAAESPRSMVAGLRQLLSEDARVSKVLAERREAVRKRTSAGLLWVNGLGPASLLAVAAVAAAALAWGRGISLLAGLLWLLWEHGSDVVAGLCVALLLTKAALAAHLDTRLRAFLDGFDDLQASVKAVHQMQEDVHRMRTIIETMQGDLEAKTAWIPKGIAPPTWLPGHKRAV